MNSKKWFGLFRFSHFKKCSIFCILFFLICTNLFAEEEITTISITNARQTTYKKAEDTGNDSIILEGSVEVTVSKGSTSSEIKADKITYDRKTEMLYAEGNVEILTKSSSAGGETTWANSLLMNTATLEGVFDGGRIIQTKSDALNLPSGSTLIVFSEVFGKGESNTIALKNSRLTFCDEEDPHWHIDATRTWLLPGGEFAFFNAFLYVGVVPVLYLPAFYYPKDELVFNPVFGYKKREGTYIQTTSYLYGRKPLDSSSNTSSSDSASAESLRGLYNFIKPSSLKEQKLEGLVLHNLDEDFSGDTTNYLKLMGDWYSNLGTMVGLDGNFQPSKQYVTKLNFNTYFGFSNTIFKDSSGNYYPYLTETNSPNAGKVYNDSSNFLGLVLPFRYAANLEFTLSKPFKLSITLPIYSDPYFLGDFKTREETMDWISYFLNNVSDDSETSTTEQSSFNWTLSASYSPTLPAVIKPYINTVSFSLNSSVNITSVNTSFDRDDPSYDSNWASKTPSRKFYYPSQVTPGTVNFAFSGTLFQWPKSSSTAGVKAQDYSIKMNKPDDIKSESEKEKERIEREQKEKAAELAKAGDKEKQEETEEEEVDEAEETDEAIALSLPSIDYSPKNNSVASGLTYTLGYNFNSTLSTQLSYASNGLKQAEDFDWENVRAFMYTLKTPMSVSSNLNYAGSFFGISNKVSFDPVWQKHPIISRDETKGGYSDSSYKSLVLADYNAENRNVTNSNTVSFKPFYYTDHFSDTGINWNTNINLYRRKFLGDVDNPSWDVFTLDWEDKDCVTTNSIDYVFGASEFNKTLKQTFTLTSVLKPQKPEYRGTLNLIFPYVTASFSSGFLQKDETDETYLENKWKKNPLQQSVSLSLFNSSLKFTESYNYNLEEKHNDSLKLSVTWKSLQLAYVQSYTTGAQLNPLTGWKTIDEKKFRPYSIQFSFTPATKTYYKWFNRITFTPGLSTSLVADMIKATNSYFIITPSISFKITDFFNITFSATSRNSILYWYFHDGMYDEWGGFPGNMFKDLIDSYRFDDTDLRKASGFKLKSLNMTMSHELHDWKFNMTFKVEPRLVTENSVTRYDFSPYITIGIVWNPMDSIKTEIEDEYGKWKLKSK